MPRSGGIFTLVPGYFAVDGTTIEVSQHNPPLEDIAQALTDSLPRDGSAPMTGNLAMGSNKITGLAAGTNAGDAVRFDQLPTVTPTTATLTAGTDAQGQGPITTDQVTITTAAANPSGATLPTAVAGKRVIIANRGANPVNIYPATGAAIGALAANAPVLLAVNQSVEFFARSATQWEGQISQPLDASLSEVAALTLVRGDLLRVGVGGVVERLPKGTAGQFVGYDANDVLAVAAPVVTPSNSGNIALSGAGPFAQTGIPATARRIRVFLEGASLSGTNDYLIQIGDSGGYETTGYLTNSDGVNGTNAAGFYVRGIGTTRSHTGVIELIKHPTTNNWSMLAGLLYADNAGLLPTNGTKLLSATLDRIQLTKSGADTFDAGNLVFEWE